MYLVLTQSEVVSAVGALSVFMVCAPGTSFDVRKFRDCQPQVHGLM